MSIQLHQASEEDVDRIAEIHLAAFDSNPLLHVQFPTTSSLQGLREILREDALKTIQLRESSGQVVLVAKDVNAGDAVISFAKWDLPTLNQEVEAHDDPQWPIDCKLEYLDRYNELAKAMKKRVIGDQKCYRMTFVGTDPKHQGKGAASLLTKWGVDRSDRDGVPVYLESTLCAVSLYEKLGFVR